MKHSRKISLVICCSLVFSVAPMKTQAPQTPVNDDKGTEKIVDAWISVTRMAFP